MKKNFVGASELIAAQEKGITHIKMAQYDDWLYGEVEGYGITIGFAIEENSGMPDKFYWGGGDIVVGAVRKRYLKVFEEEILRMAYDFLRKERIKYIQEQLDRAVTYCAEEDYIPGTTQEQQEYNRAQIKYWEDALEEVPF